MDRMQSDVTTLLARIRGGDDAALDRLMKLVYGDLHARAEACMRRERADHTLQPTALVNETYLRLVGANLPEVQDRGRFFAIATKVMRQVLVGHARKRGAARRGGGQERVPLVEGLQIDNRSPLDALALDEALQKVEEFDERTGTIVEMRLFGGLTADEVAGALDLSTRQVLRDWKVGKAILLDELGSSED